MRVLSIQAVRRCRRCSITIADDFAAKPLDLVNTEFTPAVKQQLVESGVDSDRIHYEMFGPHQDV